MLKCKFHLLLLSCLLIILFLVLFNLQLPGIINQAITGKVLTSSSSNASDSGYFAAKTGSSTQIMTDKESDQESIEEYIVDSGDTLWEIARQWGCNSRDTRELVYKIMEYNEMARADLTPGDKLLIPPNFN